MVTARQGLEFKGPQDCIENTLSETGKSHLERGGLVGR